MGLKIFQIDLVANSGIFIPELVNYRTIGLAKKITQDRGIDIATEFYRSYDTDTKQYSNLIVREEYSYIEQNPLYLGMTTLIKWYDIDDNVGYQLEQPPRIFLDSEIVEFGIQRRSNVVANAKMYCFKQLGQNAFALLDYCSVEISTYVQGNSPPLIAKVNQSVGVVPNMTQHIADGINAILTNL